MSEEKASRGQPVVLQAQDVWRVFESGPEKLEVLRGVNLKVRRGEFVAITGPSGTGKSTLLHILGGLDRPTRGRVLLDSLDIFSYPASDLPGFRNQKVGFVFQFHHLLAEFTVLENVALPLLVAGRSMGEAVDRAHAVLREIGFTERLNHRPAQLSGGEKSRTAVARALVNEPAVVLADEPTGNLDSATAEALVELLIHLNESKSMTTILVTHNDMVAQRAGRRLRLAAGVLHEE
ncbi:MAG: ABC transporter ATP-binding protein [candidate division WOR-3 bacterium]